MAGLVAQLAEATATDTAHQLLAELVDWMQRVYLRYPDAAQGLPDCWLWQPDVIEELLWLQQAWLAAYHDEPAPITAAADWHDRYRPTTVRRITAAAGRSSLENHQPRDDDQPIPGAPELPLADAVAPMASWWPPTEVRPARFPRPSNWPSRPAAGAPGAGDDPCPP